MRKTFGLLCAAALMLPVGVITAGAAGGAGATPTCTKASGTFKFTPPLPIKKTAAVKSTLSSLGTVSGCAGGGVVKGNTSFKSNPPTTKSSCDSLVHPTAGGTKGTFTVKWNNGKTSTVAKTFVIKQGTGANLATATTTGKITAGAFKGKTIRGTITFKLNSGACTTKPASGGTYNIKAKTKFTIS